MSTLYYPPGSARYNNQLDSSKYPSPFFDMASTAMPMDQTALLWCLPPGALIELGDKSLKPIEQIVAGDLVLTRGGTIEKVLRTSVRNVDEEIVELTFSGLGKSLPLQLTANHNLWRIRTPNLKPGRCNPSLDAAEKVPAEEIQVGDYVATPLPKRAKQTARFHGWLFGLYLAEGCPVENAQRQLGVRFSMGADDEPLGITTRLQDELERAVDKRPDIYTPRETNESSRLLTVWDEELSVWLEEHGGCNAKQKKLSAAVFDFSEQVILDILGGWLDGDGNLVQNSTLGRPYRGVSGNTASATLARQLQRLANCVGLTPSLCRAGNARGYAAKCKYAKTHILSFDKEDTERLLGHSLKVAKAAEQYGDEFFAKNAGPSGSFVRDGYVFRRVTGTARVEYEGPVHNFEVENDHSYVANGVTVANCHYIFYANGTYRQAINRIISYFLTDIDFQSTVAKKPLGDDEKDKWNNALRVDRPDVLLFEQELGTEFLCYGNSFVSAFQDFRRFLICPTCKVMYSLEEVYRSGEFNLRWVGFEFNAHCPRCKRRGDWEIHDEPDYRPERLRLKRWSPMEMVLEHCLVTDDTQYYWRIPEDYKQQVRKGSLFLLQRVPKEILAAISKNQQLFRFEPGEIFHAKEPTLSGIRNRGWGLPRTISNFRQVWYVQMLHKYNEAIAADYVIPFRVITPASNARGGEAVEPLRAINGGDFTYQVRRMLQKRRINPTDWFSLPYPVQYQMLGGEARQLAPRELLDQGMDELLNALGATVELYRGTLQLTTNPVSLRLFEASWYVLIEVYNSFLRWLVRKMADMFQWEQVVARHRRVTHADDMQRTMAVLQMAMGGKASLTSALRLLGLEFKDEQRTILEELRSDQEQQSALQEEMEQAATGQQLAKGAPLGLPAPGGQPGQDPAAQQGQGQAAAGAAPGMGTTSIVSMIPGNDQLQTVESVSATAAQLAERLLQEQPPQRNADLQLIRQHNETLYAAVKEELRKRRDAARSQGQQQVMLQQYGTL